MYIEPNECVCVCACMHFISTSLYYAVYIPSLCLCVIVYSSRPAVIINKVREYVEYIIVHHVIVTLYCIVETQYVKHVSSTKTFGAVYNKLSNKQTELVVRLYNE